MTITKTRPTVLITGGAQRLGARMARAFGAAGWHVAIHYRASRDAAEKLCEALPSAETVVCDLNDIEAVRGMARDLAERHDNWAALVNSAAIFEVDHHDALDPAVFARTMQVNALAPAILMQEYLSHARASAGRRVVNVLDMKLANINPDFFSYTMAKFALGAAGAMAARVRDRGPDRIYGLAPGAMLPSHDQRTEEHEISGRMNLLQRITGPDELAEAAVFLAGGTLANGQVLYVDSGQHLMEQDRDVLFLARESGSGTCQPGSAG